MSLWRRITIPALVCHVFRQVIPNNSLHICVKKNVNITSKLVIAYPNNLSCDAIRWKSKKIETIGHSYSIGTTEPPIITAAIAKQTASLIFLHGLGDTGHGWASIIAPILGPHMKMICPNAPTIPVTINSGTAMPSWFDIKSLDKDDGLEDEKGIISATDQVHRLINDEIKSGIPSNRILLGGFSQGGALALHAGLTYSKPLAGIMSLSCWMLRNAHFPKAVKAPLDTPVFLGHGHIDPVVPFKYGEMTASFLKTFMKNVEFFAYKNLVHSYSETELTDMKTYMTRILPAKE